MPKKKQQGCGFYDQTVNRIFGSNLRDKEIHAPVWTPGGLKFGSFIGPGSDVIGRIRDGIQPVSNSDRVAQKHDLAYGFAKNAADVRTADLKMVNKLYDLQKNNEEYRVNVWTGALPIRLKMWAEDRGIIKPGSFADLRGWNNADDEKIARDKFDELEQQGYGKKKKKAKKKPKKK